MNVFFFCYWVDFLNPFSFINSLRNWDDFLRFLINFSFLKCLQFFKVLDLLNLLSFLNGILICVSNRKRSFDDGASLSFGKMRNLIWSLWLILIFKWFEFFESFFELSFSNGFFSFGKELLFKFSGSNFGLKHLLVLSKFFFGGFLKFEFEFLWEKWSGLKLSIFYSFDFVLSFLVLNDCGFYFFYFWIYMLIKMVEDLLRIWDLRRG